MIAIRVWYVYKPPMGHAGYTGISPTVFAVRPSRQRERPVQSGIGANRTARKRQWPYVISISNVLQFLCKLTNIENKIGGRARYYLHGPGDGRLPACVGHFVSKEGLKRSPGPFLLIFSHVHRLPPYSHPCLSTFFATLSAMLE